MAFDIPTKGYVWVSPSTSRITLARLTHHGEGWIPKAASIFRQSRTEFIGRWAGVGYWSRPCENVREPRKRRTVFSITFIG